MRSSRLGKGKGREDRGKKGRKGEENVEFNRNEREGSGRLTSRWGGGKEREQHLLPATFNLG